MDTVSLDAGRSSCGRQDIGRKIGQEVIQSAVSLNFTDVQNIKLKMYWVEIVKRIN
ncbi:hypothetical protein [Methanosarcina sp.]|jgi:hypothetical protein|uniref:hypothetical protein n=1 Tax=Methanosarcina sp. TaxID=2213 RepID=UPI002BEAC8B8|nr:hypothetical protein [Methanosarcina sp.]HOW13762.1 hypothetical protein [Methanosarcina sp.]